MQRIEPVCLRAIGSSGKRLLWLEQKLELLHGIERRRHRRSSWRGLQGLNIRDDG